jgi:hypothetical protein
MLPRPTAATPTADFIITYHGTVATLDVLSRTCLSWVEENVAVEPWQRIGASAICIDPRIAEELREALIEAGFWDQGGSRQ